MVRSLSPKVLKYQRRLIEQLPTQNTKRAHLALLVAASDVVSRPANTLPGRTAPITTFQSTIYHFKNVKMTTINDRAAIDEHYEILKRRTGLTEFPDWGNGRVKRPEDVPDYEYYKALNASHPKRQTVPVNQIVGTDHPSYIGLTWNEMLVYLKRNFVADVTAAYREFDSPGPEPVHFAKYGNQYFILAGNHRSCMAKFGSRPEVSALVTEHVFDSELFTARTYLLKYFALNKKLYDTYESEFIRVILNDRKALVEFYHYFYSLPPLSQSSKIVSRLTGLLPSFFSDDNDRLIYVKWPDTGNHLDIRDLPQFRKALLDLKNKFGSTVSC